MRISVLLPLLLAVAAWAQTPAAKTEPPAPAAAKTATPAPPAAVPAQPAPLAKPGSQTIPFLSVMNLLKMPPTQLVATVDGNKVFAGELQMYLRAYPAEVQQEALKNPRQILEGYGVVKRLLAEAEKEKLDQQSPFKDQIADFRMQVLAQARFNQRINEIQVPPEDVKKAYEANLDRFMQAKVKAIYIPFSTAPVSQADQNGKKLLTEEEAKAKALDLLKQIRAGADFVKLVKENSGDPTSVAKDGDFGTIKKSDQISGPVKSAIFAAKAGEVTEPVRQSGGFYLFRIEEMGPQPFEEAQLAITNDLRRARFGQWYAAERKSVEIKEEGIEMKMEAAQPSSPAKPAPAPAPKP